MKVSCNVNTLRNAVEVAAAVAPKRAVAPIVKNIALQAKDDKMYVLATDFEVEIRVLVDAVEVLKPGMVLLNAKQAVEILRSVERLFPVEIESSDSDSSYSKRVEILCGGDEFVLQTEDPQDFPVIPDLEDSAGDINVPADVLASMYRKTYFAAAKEKGRYALNGILLSAKDGRLRAVGCDGRRLSLAESPVENADGIFSVVPVRALDAVISMVNLHGSTDVSLRSDESRVLFCSESCVLSTRIVSGEYPDYESVLPKGDSLPLTLDKKDLLNALKKSTILLNKMTDGCLFEADGNMLHLKASSADVGRSSSKVKCQSDGEFRCVLNPAYVTEATKTFSDDTVTIHTFGKGKAVLLSDNDGTKHVVMPIAQ